VRAAGGSVIAQTTDTAVVASMPGAVADAGLADAVIPLDGIAPEMIVRLSGHQ
jgi:two-component system chemotaxis response regulator CheB